MKKLKIYKKAVAALTLSTVVLFSGCTEGTNSQKNSENCFHLTIYFEDKPVTFKECEGHEIDTTKSSVGLWYSISNENDTLITDGYTNQYNCYYVNHNNADEIIDHSSVQKHK